MDTDLALLYHFGVELVSQHGIIDPVALNELIHGKTLTRGQWFTKIYIASLANAGRGKNFPEELAELLRKEEHKIPGELSWTLKAIEVLCHHLTAAPHLSDALSELGTCITQQCLAWQSSDQYSQNIVWLYWRIRFEGPSPPYMNGSEWRQAKQELGLLSQPSKRFTTAFGFMRYFEKFCNLETLPASQIISETLEASNTGQTDYDFRDHFNSICLLVKDIDYLDPTARETLLSLCEVFVAHAQGLYGLFRLRVFLRELSIIETYRCVIASYELRGMVDWEAWRIQARNFASKCGKLAVFVSWETESEERIAGFVQEVESYNYINSTYANA